jgi:type III restriction enzyme
MKGFNFEKNLTHQTQAVESICSIFENIDLKQPEGADKNHINPTFNFSDGRTFFQNIRNVHSKNGIDEKIKLDSHIIDIMMETGTGKTYVYTKTIFELNRQYGIFKFVIVVPTLSIKAGTIDFLKSDSSREHFKEQYGKTIQLHVVESQKSNKNKKSYYPQAVASFANAGNFGHDAKKFR